MSLATMAVVFSILLGLGACRRKVENDHGDQIAPTIFYWPDGGCVHHFDDTPNEGKQG